MPLLKKRFSNPHQQITVKPVETRRGASKIKPYKIHQQTYLNVRPVGADVSYVSSRNLSESHIARQSSAGVVVVPTAHLTGGMV